MDLRSKLTLDGSDFSSTMNDAGKSVDDFQKKTDTASKSVDDMGKASKRTASELLQQMKTMEGLGRNTSNYRQQLAQISKQIQDLTINYRSMSDEMKNSDFGREVASKLVELKDKASEYKDAIMDAQSSVKLLASDTANLDAAKAGIEAISSAMTLVASAGILGADSTEKLVKVMARLKAIEAATNAVIKIANLLNKDSILMLKIKEIQTKAATAAQTKYTAATGAATIAQRLFNTVAKSNPYVLLATAILAVVGAMTMFSSKAEEATEALDDYESLAQKTAKTQNDLAQSYGTSAGQMMGSFIALREQWKLLSTEMEKNKFIDENKKEFEKLGLAVNDLNTAEQVFTEYNDVIIKSFDLRARAAAAAAVAAKKYQQALELREQAKNLQGRYKVGDVVPLDLSNSDRAYYGRRRTDKKGNEYGDYVFDETGLSLFYADKKGEAFRLENEGLDLYVQSAEYQQELNKLVEENTILQQKNNEVRSNQSGTTARDNGPGYEEGSIAALRAQVTKLKDEYDNSNISIERGAEILKEIEAIEANIVKLEAQRERLANQAIAIPALPAINTNDAIKTLETYYEEHPIKVTVEPEIHTLSTVEFLGNIKGNIGQLNAMNSAVKSIGDSVNTLNKGWDDSKSFIENITTTIGALLTILNSVVTLMETIETIKTAINALTGVGIVMETAEGKQIAMNTVAEGALVGEKATEATLTGVSAAGEAAKSAAKIPVVGWVLAIGAIAAIIAALAAAKSSLHFAHGGIVPGASFGGDNVTAQVNSGEMILNTQQQRNLFSLLDNGAAGNGGGKVEFVLKGQELRGVLNNYDKKLSKI